MRLEKRPHADTREPAWHYVDWKLRPDLAKGRGRWEIYGVVGEPMQRLVVCADRVELYWDYCFSSGHMETYETLVPLVFRRGPDGRFDAGLHGLLVHRFGDELAAEAEALLADRSKFAP